jgi:glycosyltransferase involved in cell wall biosynthesis
MPATLQPAQSDTHTLSVMIPTRSNTRTIGRVLDSIRGLATQLVVVDSGSTDDTMDLVLACRDWSGIDRCEVVLIETPWRGYVRTKQLALDACTHDFVLWIDSDEPVTPELADGIRDAMDRGVDAGKVNRKVEYKGKVLEHCWQPEHRLRFVRTALAKANRARFAGKTHDYLEVDPPVKPVLIAGTLIHNSFETFAKHLESQRHYSYIFAKALSEQGKRGSAWKILTSPPGAFLKQLVLKGAWRDGYAGWLCAGTSAAGALMKHMMLYEMGQHDSE